MNAQGHFISRLVERILPGKDWVPPIALSRRIRKAIVISAALLFVAETLVHAFVIRTDGRLFDRLVPRTEELLGHVVAAAIILALGAYAHWLVTRSTRIRDTLQKRADQSAGIVRSVPGFAVCLAAQHRIVDWNAELETFFERSQADALGLDFLELCIPDCFRASFARSVRQTLLGETMPALETIIPGRDGTGYLISWRFQAIAGPDGKPAQVVALGRDITAERAARDAMQAAGQRHRDLFENLSGGVIVLAAVPGSEGFVVRDLNAGAEGMDNLTRRQVVGRGLNKVLPYAGSIGLNDLLQRVAETGETQYHAAAMPRSEAGPADWREYRVSRLPSGEFMIAYHDITARRRVEETRERIAWMLNTGGDDGVDIAWPTYGDPVAASRNRMIRDGAGDSDLQRIADDLLALLGAEVTILETNGDYASCRLASGWCRYLDESSRALCSTVDNREAVCCGQWLCHESRCNGAGRTAMTTGEPVDLPCAGGLRVLAVPIWRGTDVIGAVTLGYGDPPSDTATVARLAARYRADAETLQKLAESYRSRPPFLVEYAKRRLFEAAREIGSIIDRRRMEENLRTTEARFEDLTTNASDWLWETDISGAYTYSSSRVKDILGYEPDDIIGRTPFEFMTDSEARRMGVLFDSRAQRKQPLRACEHSKIHRDGREIRLVSTGVPLLDEDGRLIGYRGVDTDVTDRVRAEEESRQREAEHRQIVDHAREAIIIIRDNAVQSVNDRFLRLTGRARSALIGQPFADLVHSEDRMMVTQRLADVVLGGSRPDTFTYRITGKDGSVRWIEHAAVRIEQGGEAAILSFLQDVTAQRHVAAKLTEMEERQRTITDHLLVAAYSAPAGDLQERRFTAGRIDELCGYSAEDFTADPGLFARLIHPEDRDRLPQRFNRGPDDDVPQEAEYRVVTRRGQVRWLRDTARPVLDKHGRLVRLDGVIIDVTENHEVEDALLERDSELHTLSENMPILMAYIDRDERHHFANDIYLTTFQATRREVIGKRIAELLDAPGYAAVSPYVRRALAGERASGEVTIRVRSNELALEIVCVPDAADGQVRGVYAFALDRSAQRKAEEAQHKAEEARHEAEETQREAEVARRDAEVARQEAEESQRESEQARREAEAARREAEGAQEKVSAARREAEGARREIAAAQREAEAARRDAVAAQREARHESEESFAETEAALHRQETELNLLLDVVGDGLMTLAPDLTVLRHNGAIGARLGRSFEGEKCYAALRDRERPCDKCPAMSTLRDGGPHEQMSMPCGLSPSGTVRTCALRSAAGEVEGLIAWLRMDSEEVPADHDEIAARYAFLAENQTELLVSLDSSGRVRFASPSTCTTLGREEGDLDGLAFSELVQPDERDEIGHLFGDMHHPPHTRRIDLHMQAAGQWRPFRWVFKASIEPNGHVVEFIGNAREADDEPAAAEPRLAETQTQLDVQRRELVGERAQLEARQAEASATQARLAAQQTELASTHAMLETEQAELAAARSTLEKQQRELASTRDILEKQRKDVATERAQLEAARSEQKDETALKLQAKELELEAVRSLAGGVAREFGDVLRAIEDRAGELMISLEGRQTLAAEAAAIKTTGNRGVTLIRHIEALAPAAASSSGPADLNMVVKEMEPTLSAILSEGRSVAVDLDQSLPRVAAGSVGLEKTLSSLVLSIRNSLPRNGRLIIKTQTLNASNRGSDAPVGEFVRMSFSGRGLSITQEIVDRAAEPYSQPAKPGLGPALSVAYGFVRQYRGVMRVARSKGSESSLEVYLPVASEKVEAAQQRQPNEDQRGKGESVLTVADRPGDLMLATQTLWKSGYRVMSVGSPGKALEYCTQGEESFVLVLCDVNQPTKRWMQLIEQLQRQRPGIAILVCSESVRGWSQVEKLGVTILEKPYRAPVLLRAMRKALGARGAQESGGEQERRTA